jgi:hypothetical protein
VTIDDGRVGFTERGEGLLDRIAAEIRRVASDNPELEFGDPRARRRADGTSQVTHDLTR